MLNSVSNKSIAVVGRILIDMVQGVRFELTDPFGTGS